MPGMDGLEVASMKKLTPMPVVVITGTGRRTTRRRPAPWGFRIPAEAAHPSMIVDNTERALYGESETLEGDPAVRHRDGGPTAEAVPAVAPRRKRAWRKTSPSFSRPVHRLAYIVAFPSSAFGCLAKFSLKAVMGHR